MSFAISNAIYACQGRLENNLLNRSNIITGVVDLAIIATASIIGGLMLGGIVNFGLPSGVGTISNGLSWGCIGVGGGIAIADIIAAIIISRKDPTSAQYRDLILNVQEVNPTRDELNANKAACHQIMNGLYLGNSEAFAQTTHLYCTFPDKGGRAQPVDTSNPLNFTTVITVCPLQSIFRDYADWSEKSADYFADSFSANEITWHHVGKMAADEPSYWGALVYDCTCLDTELAQATIPKQGIQEGEFERIRHEKTTAMLNIPVQFWFEPIFKEIDEAVINGKKVLVHCQAGVSRSATVLAAYLINRFNVSSAQAIAFLKSKRFCVDPIFDVQLYAYAEQLHSASKAQL